LWAVTMVMNLLGGWLIAAIIAVGFPSLRSTAAEAAQFCITLGATWQAFALALMGGFLITLMTHMQRSTEEPPQEHKRRSGPTGDRPAVHRSAGGYDDVPHGLDAPPQAIWSKHKQ